MKTLPLIAAALASGLAAPALAQDAARGARLYADTAKLTGKPVASCASCHSDMATLRELLANRGGKPDDASAVARRLEAIIAGAQPGSANAKAQYRGVLTSADLRDLAAYIARARQVLAPPSLAAPVAQHDAAGTEQATPHASAALTRR